MKKMWIWFATIVLLLDIVTLVAGITLLICGTCIGVSTDSDNITLAGWLLSLFGLGGGLTFVAILILEMEDKL